MKNLIFEHKLKFSKKIFCKINSSFNNLELRKKELLILKKKIILVQAKK